MKRVLITGGAGFIGSNLALKLIGLGYEVTVMDNLDPQVHGEDVDKSYTYNLIKGKVDFVKGDVRDRGAWKKCLTPDIDIIVHLAAETGTGQSMYEVDRYVGCNVGGTALLLDELVNNKELKVKKLIIASSRAVYGEGKYRCEEHGVVYPETRADEDMAAGVFDVKCPICGKNLVMELTDEESTLHPTSVYGYTKKVQEELAILVGKSIGLPVVAFRFQNVYGPGQSLKNPYTGILSIFSTQIKNGNNINIFEDGKETRDFVYVDDVTDAMILAFDNDAANYEVFNVGSGEELDVVTIAETLKNKYSADVEIKVSGNYRLGDIRGNLADLAKPRAILGYEPKIKFEQGISNFVDWVERQEVEADIYEKSIEEMQRRGLYK